jgi:hypothetical protein
MGFAIDNQMPLDQGLAAYDITDRVTQDYVKSGFPVPACPLVKDYEGRDVPYQGGIPTDPTTLSDEDLSKYMGLLSTWLEYVGYKQTIAELAHTTAVSQLEFVSATVRLEYKHDEEGKKRTVQERDDCVKRDRRFVQAQESANYTEAVLSLTASTYKAAQQKYKLLSRRITQRGQEIERANRNEGVIRGGAGPMFPGRR